MKDEHKKLKLIKGGAPPQEIEGHLTAPQANDLAEQEPLPEFSEFVLADRFVERHGDELRYIAALNQMKHWSGTVWEAEQTYLAFDLARRVARDAAIELECRQKSTPASRVARAAMVSSIVTLARADRKLASRQDAWDCNDWLLNTPEGTINLNSGKRYKNNPNDYITKITAVAPGGDCPEFMRFLDRITGSDQELQKFLQRLFGYALTGSTREQKLFFFYGTGANGKSVLLRNISAILADYATNAPMETFTASKVERHPTELAKLRDARLVTATETETGRQWAESRIKELTGGDTVSARVMRGDYFDFKPRFKLVMAGNEKPSLSRVDEAIRRRFNLVPFTVTIPVEERDDNIDDKLRPEYPGILRWMIEGCVEWQRLGDLAAPECVTEATKEYLEGEDTLSQWLAERCEVDKNFEDRSGALWDDWRSWCEKVGEKRGTQRMFSQSLSRNFKSAHARAGTVFHGLKLMARRDWGEP